MAKALQKILMCLETQMKKIACPLQLCSSLMGDKLGGDGVLEDMLPF